MPEQAAPHVWNRAAILARIKTVLDPAEFQCLEARLNNEWDGAEAAWLEHVVDAATTLPLPAVPDDLARSLRSMFDAISPREQVPAVLVNDSRIERSLTGVRGDDEEGWTLSFSSELGTILVECWPDGENFGIETQLMSSTASAQFTLDLSGPEEITTVSDRLGRTSVTDAPPGRYDAVVRHLGVEVSFQVDLAPCE